MLADLRQCEGMRRPGRMSRRRQSVLGALMLVLLASPGCSGAEPAQRAFAKTAISVVSPEPAVTTTTLTAPTPSTTVAAPRPVPPPSTAAPYPRSNGSRPDDALDRPEDVTLTVQVDRRRVRQGDTINGSLTAVNNSTETVDITHPSTCLIESALYFDGKLRTERWLCGSEIVDDELAPGETRVWRFDLVVRGDLARYDEGRNHDFHPVPPGRYDLFAGITAYQQLNRPEGEIQVRGGVWYGPPVAIEVIA